ncbi:MAG: nucleotide exchange factor GrpE [Thermodesulfovibrionaceae bacterium]
MQNNAEVKGETLAIEEKSRDLIENLQKEIEKQKEKYLRLYAEFENYKKMVNKEREEIISYANEKLIKELLPVIDNLELAVKHSQSNLNLSWLEAVRVGVENAIREFLRVLEKFGVKPIDSLGQAFNPEIHDAISVVETEEAEENTVVEEIRKGYLYKDKVLRASLVAVSKKPKPSSEGATHPLGAQKETDKED